MKFYKYYSNIKYVKDLLENNNLYFANVSEFNDPFEEQAIINESGIYYEIEGLKNSSRLCCFSTTCNNYLLWSHYANKHQGFCIVFDFKNVKFDQDQYCYTKILNQDIVFGKMKYKISHKKFEKLPDEIQSTEYLDFFYQKYKCWKYEKEVRALIQKPSRYKKIKISSEMIKEVICGYKNKDMELIKNIIKEKNLQIKIKKAYIAYNETIAINIREY